MQEIRFAKVNNREIPVLISDEKEALLAAKAAGRALVGLWRPGMEMEELEAAEFVAEELSAVSEEFLERVARRHLGLPWRICETERLRIREICGADFDEIWDQQVGRGLDSVEGLEAYTKHQYGFYGFGFWALVEKESGELIGVAGVTVPREERQNGMQRYRKALAGERGRRAEKDGPVIREGKVEGTVKDGPVVREEKGKGTAKDGPVVREGKDEGAEKDGPAARETEAPVELELGYHIFPPYRRKGYAREACLAIMDYAARELEADFLSLQIAGKNLPSKALAETLGFKPVADGSKKDL